MRVARKLEPKRRFNLRRCTPSIAKIKSAHSTRSAEMIVSALGLVPADKTSYPSIPEKAASAVGLRRQFRLQTNSRLIQRKYYLRGRAMAMFLEGRLFVNFGFAAVRSGPSCRKHRFPGITLSLPSSRLLGSNSANTIKFYKVPELPGRASSFFCSFDISKLD
jgi:hypothetical protein